MTTLITRRSLFKVMAAAGIAVGSLQSKVMAATESVQNGISMVAAIFFDSYGAVALQRALRYAGDDGFVASLPALLHARANAPYDNIIWNTWFTANSEENVVTTPQGNHVVVTVHGGGIFARPARLERSTRADLSRSNPEDLTGQYAAKISEQEGRDLLQGRLSDGAEFPVYAFDEFRRGIKDLPRRYGIVMDFELAKKTKSDYDSFEALGSNPVLIVRAGGVEPLTAYLDKAQARHNTKVMGNWHPFGRIDPDQPQTRILEIAGNKGGVGSEGSDQRLSWGYGEDYGITGNGGMPDMARYVAVAPRTVSTSLQDLDFELCS